MMLLFSPCKRPRPCSDAVLRFVKKHWQGRGRRCGGDTIWGGVGGRDPRAYMIIYDWLFMVIYDYIWLHDYMIR